MPAKLAPDKSITREIALRCLGGNSVVVRLSADGITVGTKRRKPLNITWGEIIDASCTPADVPAKFYKRGFDYLNYCLSKEIKRAKKAAKASDVPWEATPCELAAGKLKA